MLAYKNNISWVAFALWLWLVFAGSIMSRQLLPSESKVILITLGISVIWPVFVLGLYPPFSNSLKSILKHRTFLNFLGCYFTICLTSSLLGPSFFESVVFLLLTILSLVICFSFSLLLSEEEICKSLHLFSLLSVILLLIYLKFSEFDHKGRLTGVLNPNSIGMISFSIVTVSFWGKSQILKFFNVGVGCYVLYLTGSRSAIVGTVASLVVCLLLKKKKNTNFLTVSLMIFSLVVIVALIECGYLNLGSFVDNLLALHDPYRGLQSGATGRFGAWQEAWQMFLENPIFGIGYRMHEKFMVTESSSHNGYLAILAETGVLGAGAVVYLVVVSVENLYGNREGILNVMGLGLIFGYLAVSFFERYFFNLGNPASLLFMFFLAMGFSLSEMKKRDKIERKSNRVLKKSKTPWSRYSI